MANSYFQFSEVLKFKTPEAATLFKQVATVAELLFNGDVVFSQGDDYPEEHKDNMTAFLSLSESDRERIIMDAECGYFDFEDEGHGNSSIWVHSDEVGNMDLVGSIASAVLEATGDHDTVFTLSGAGTCSRPILGEFGGSWIAVSSKAVKCGSTWDAAEKAAQALRKGQ